MRSRTKVGRITRRRAGFPYGLVCLLAAAGVSTLIGCQGYGGEGPESARERIFVPGAEPEAVAGERLDDPSRGTIDLGNLYANERFWPYQIQLTSDWKPEGWEGEFGWGLGVVLRIDPAARLRVDFGSFGKHWIPASATDVVARANALREGRATKLRPNLTLALDNRLFDVSGEKLRPARTDLGSVAVFLLVFADPVEPGFAGLAEVVRPLAAKNDVIPVLVSPIDHGDFEIARLCQEAGWSGLFLRDRFGPAYTEGYLGKGVQGPRFQALTAEGRLLWEQVADGHETAASLLRVLDEIMDRASRSPEIVSTR